MKKLIFVFMLILFLQTNAKENSFSRANYFPINPNIELIYDSSFGEVSSSIKLINDTIQIINSADDFYYAQKMLLRNDSILVVETHQKLSVLLFINKENKIFYKNPLLRIPFPLTESSNWESSTQQYFNKNSPNKRQSKVMMSGNMISEEKIKTKIGTFETIKIITTVKTDYGSENIITEWYAKDIGLIKAEIEVKGGGFTGFLRDILGYGLITFEIVNIKYKS